MSSSGIVRFVTDVLRKLASPSPTKGAAPGTRRPAKQPSTTRAARGQANGAYPGDFLGAVRADYSPSLDGKPDPGEVVWTWVPFEEDHSQGKDRPVLVVGRDGTWLLGLQLTSKDHGDNPIAGNGGAPARGGQRRNGAATWLDIGSGPWDSKGRASEVRLDRVIRIDPAAVRREGAIVPRETFEAVVAASAKARTNR